MKKTTFIFVGISILMFVGCRGGKVGEGEGMCGNGIIEGAEFCDGDDLGGETCESLGLEQGELACTGACVFDTSGCDSQAECGNGEVEFPEECDGTDLNGATCENLGLGTGEVSCNADCTLDVSQCIPETECGNGIKEEGEDCDGEDLGDATCDSLGLGEGDLGCTDSCSFDTSMCEVQTECGNNLIEGNETCDGTDLGGQTCQDLDFYGGELGCLSDCSGFDTSECEEEETGFCGDNILNGDEECDGDDLGGLETCADFNCRVEGVVTCTENCTFDLSECFSGHDEDGDSIDDNCDNCPAYHNPEQMDTDGDGVGNVCEMPDDDTTISSISVFDPMLENEDLWFDWGGTWSYGEDVVGGSRFNGPGNYLHDEELPEGAYAVEATFHYEENAPYGSSWAGVIFAVQDIQATPSAYNCLLERSSNDLGIWRLPSGGNWNRVVNTTVTTTVDDADWHKIHVFHDGEGLVCAYQDESGAFEMIELPPEETAEDLTGLAGLRVYNERAVFSSFVIYH